MDFLGFGADAAEAVTRRLVVALTLYNILGASTNGIIYLMLESYEDGSGVPPYRRPTVCQCQEGPYGHQRWTGDALHPVPHRSELPTPPKVRRLPYRPFPHSPYMHPSKFAALLC